MEQLGDPRVIETSETSRDVVVLPIGGLGRIGMNMTLIGVRGAWHVIDCGVRFPDPEQFGAASVLPDLGWLETIAPDIQSVVLTHGHEDHIGALPHLLRRVKAPVLGTRFTLELVRRKLSESPGFGDVDLRTIAPGERCSFPGIEFGFVRVTHSIPDCVSVVAHTDQGTVLHTGDWKIDREPVDGERFDEARFKSLGDAGVRLLLSDSTNALVPGWTASEASLVEPLKALVEGAPGRVLVTTFASNLHRLESVCRIAEEAGRSVCLLGRSLSRYVEVARAAGRWSPDPGLLVAPERLDDLPDEHLLIVTTGTQGESSSALARLSRGDHPLLSVRAGDRVLHSARVIPGNERAVNAMFSGLIRRGAEVVHGWRSGIHCSGHARQDELDHMLGLVRPNTFVPIHGEVAFLREHAERARRAGVQEVHEIENGVGIVLKDEGVHLESLGVLDTWFDDGTRVGTFEELGMRDRVRLAYNGVVGVHVRWEGIPGAGEPVVDLDTRGLYTDEGRLLDRCRREVAGIVTGIGGTPGDEPMEDVIARAVRRFFKRDSGRRPEVMVFLAPRGAGERGSHGKG